MPPAPGMPFGVQTWPNEVTNAVPRDRAQEAAVRWTRADVAWESIEPLPPYDPGHAYQWAALDLMVASMMSGGFIPLLTVGTSPQWAVENMPVDSGTGRHYNCGPIDEGDLGAFGSFVQALVERYDGDGVADGPGVVKYWEFWNEPDGMGPKGLEFSGCWGGFSDSDRDWDNDGLDDPQEYARMLTYAYPALKAASSQVQLSFGAIAYDRSYSVDYFNLDFANQALDYLQGTYGSDPSYPFFDTMSFHAYSNPTLSYNWSPPSLLGKATGRGVANTYNSTTYMAGRPSVRSMLTNHGLAKPLICSEFGRASGGGQTAVDPPETDEGQSRYVVRGMVHVMTLWPNAMNAGVWFSLVDPLSPTKPFGLLLPGTYERKSAWYAYQTTTAELNGTTYSRTLSETGIEGYVFNLPGGINLPGGGEKTVLWVPPDSKAVPGSARTRDFTVAGGQQLRVVQMVEVTAGSDEWRWREVLIQDGGTGDLDGSTNGVVRIQINSNPQFVQ